MLRPRADKTIAAIAEVPFAWLTYTRILAHAFDVPRAAPVVQGINLIRGGSRGWPKFLSYVNYEH